ncbi:MAG TPA: zinc-ribbon domain-containing protein [Ktedonobacteraceae bacterium]|jgi:hypothetical protein|nr:zinc-ribbon domain-containing protein [Ktedonobacteraceae bacterium]
MTTRPITGQYEYVHASGVGLDYFTSRIDRLTLQADGRFVLIVQNRSRVGHAAHSLANGQQVTAAAQETRREGRYTHQGVGLALYFDDGGFEPGKVAGDGTSVQLGPNVFSKVSDSTVLPPTHRLQKDMDDIAKGVKIVSTLGSMAAKAVKTVQHTVQTTQSSPEAVPQQPASPTMNTATPTPQPNYTPPSPAGTQPQPTQAARFCDQCGARCRPGKRFCSQCGARLP